MIAVSSDVLRICVTVPYYSDLEYLGAALRSLIDQSDRHWTAFVVDDSAPAHGAEPVVAALGDRRIRYVRNEHNLGVAANFNRCLELGSVDAEIVTVFHADDVLEPGYIAAIRSAHRAFPSATCVAPRVTVIDGNGAPAATLADSVKRILWPRALPATLAGERGLAKLMRGLFFYCPSVSYRVALLPERHFDGRWKQVMDLDLFARLLLDGGSVVVVPDHAYRYRRHDATMTAQNSRTLVRLDEEVTVSREVRAAARSLGWARAARSAQLRPTVRLNGLLEAARLVARRQFRAGVAAFRLACGR